MLGKLPEAQRVLVEGYYYRRDEIEALAEHSGRTVAATYKLLQRVRAAASKVRRESFQTGTVGLDETRFPFQRI